MAARVKRFDGIIIEVKKIDPRNCLGHCGLKFVPEHERLHVCPSCSRINESINGREYRIARAE